MKDLTSDRMVSRVRDLVHEERNRTGESTELHVAALELATYHLGMRDKALELEAFVHKYTKGE